MNRAPKTYARDVSIDYLRAKGEKKHWTNVQCREGHGAKGVPWKALENDGKRTICTWNVGILLPRKR